MEFVCSNCKAITDAEPVYSEEQDRKCSILEDDFGTRQSEYEEIVVLCAEAEVEWEEMLHKRWWLSSVTELLFGKPFNDFLKRQYPKLVELIKQGKIAVNPCCGGLLPRVSELRSKSIESQLWNYRYFCTNCGYCSKYWGCHSGGQWPTGTCDPAEFLDVNIR